MHIQSRPPGVTETALSQTLLWVELSDSGDVLYRQPEVHTWL